MKISTWISLFALFLLLANSESKMVISNKKSFESVVSYVDVGFQQINIFLKNDIISNENKIVLYDISMNELSVLTESVILESNVIKSPKEEGYRNQISNNIYADAGVNGSLWSETFTNRMLSFTYNSTIFKVVFAFGRNKGQYFLFRNQLNNYWYEQYQNSLLLRNFIYYEHHILDVLPTDITCNFVQKWVDANIKQVVVSTFILNDYDRGFDDIAFQTQPQTAKWAFSNDYFALYDETNSKVFIYKFDYVSKKYEEHLEMTISGTVHSMAISNEFLIISVDTEIRQFAVQTAQLIETAETGLSNMTVVHVKSTDAFVLWKYNHREMFIYTVTHDECDASVGCECAEGHCFDSTWKYCFDGRGNECEFPYVVEQPEEPQEPEQPEQPEEIEEPEEPLEPEESDSSQNEDQTKQFCLVYEKDHCATVCSKECRMCENNSKKCIECEEEYEMNQQGKCTLSIQSQIIVGLSSAVNLVKGISTQTVNCMLFIDGLEFYNFHKKPYRGIFGDTLEFLDFVEDNMWSIIPSASVLEFLNEPLDLPNYNAYTNPQFLERKRMNSLFWQNTKKYFFVALPFSVLYFVVMNRLFWILSEYKVSSLLRVFSFWMQLGLMLAVQNISLLNYFFLQNIGTFFSLDSQSKILNYVTLCLYGTFLVFCLIFLPVVFVSYEKLAVHFLSNSRIVPWALPFAFTRYILRPIVEGFVHIFLHNNQQLQLTMLAIISLGFVLTALVFEMIAKFSENKFVFAVTCFLDFGMFVLNFLLMGQNFLESSLFNMTEECITTLMYCFFGCFIFLFLQPVFYSVISFISKKCQPKTTRFSLQFNCKTFLVEKQQIRKQYNGNNYEQNPQTINDSSSNQFYLNKDKENQSSSSH